MAQTVRDVMTPDVITVQTRDMVADAAKVMKEANIGDVIVMHDDQVFGILTDRDIVVRVVAEGKDVNTIRAGEVSSHSVVTVSPDDPVSKAVEIMRSKAIRRLPVMDGGKVVGFLSIGDLAVERDPESALGEISAAPPNV